MQVRTLDGHYYQDIAPIGIERDPPPAPVFWAANHREAIERGIDRAMALQPSMSPVAFGWGDCGEANLVVYRQIGEITIHRSQTVWTWTISLLHGYSMYPARRFTTAPADVATAKVIAVASLTH